MKRLNLNLDVGSHARSRGGRKYVLLVTKTMHVSARGGGKALFCWKKEPVFQGVAIIALLVSKNMHVFARGGSNFELFWWSRNGLFRGVANVFLC